MWVSDTAVWESRIIPPTWLKTVARDREAALSGANVCRTRYQLHAAYETVRYFLQFSCKLCVLSSSLRTLFSI